MGLKPLLGSIVAVLIASACTGDAGIDSAVSTITELGLAARIEALADDSMLGRGPASAGEGRTLAYLERVMRAIGLAPGNGDSYLQEVPLVSIAADPNMPLTIRGNGAVRRFAYGREFMGWTKRVTGRVDLVDSELLFVGYGIVAPEYGWNDYEGVDVRGKTVVILVNDPGFVTQDTALFAGNAMTYYGRWTYKYEEAARQGAAGAIIVHETAPAGYPWGVVSGSWSGPQFDLVRADSNMSRVRLEGWVTLESARTIFRQAGLNYDSLKAGARHRDFQPVMMGMTASASIRNSIRRSSSHNVLGLLRGTSRPDEIVVYMAHWDHLGVGPAAEGDSIYNGAVDNASGTAGILEIAEAFAALPEPPTRSVLFIALAAEEQGLLGSAYYTEYPVFPLRNTIAAINVDILNVWGPTGDVTLVGYGNSELDRYVERHAQRQGRTVHGDAEPQKGFYFRSDHFNFAKRGVPSAWLEVGADHPDHGPGWIRERRAGYDEHQYHSPDDEVQADWDLAGGVLDLRLAFRVGHELATGTMFPSWHAGTPFKAVRDSMMR